MFDSLVNLIFVLIPVAILIGRGIMQARAKYARTDVPPPPPLHFEEAEEVELAPNAEALSPERNFLPMNFPAEKVWEEAAKQAVPPAPKQAPQPEPAPLHSPPPPLRPRTTQNLTGGIQPQVLSRPAPQTWLSGMARLTPLQQAVVMAEILGRPKGMA